MPYSGQRKLEMRKQRLLTKIAKKQEELEALEWALEEVDDVIRGKGGPMPDTPVTRFYGAKMLNELTRPSPLFERIR